MRFFARPVAACSLLFVLPAVVAAQNATPMGTTEYYPLKVGTTWTYSTSEGVLTTKVVKHEEVGGVMCARIEATADNKKTSEYVHVAEDGVYRYQASDQNITPPLLFLKLPIKEGLTWTVNSKVLGKTLKGTFKMSIGDVTLKKALKGKKDFTGVVICRSDDFEIDGQKVPHTYYFAKGIGIIKQVINFAGLEIVLELEDYTIPE